MFKFVLGAAFGARFGFVLGPDFGFILGPRFGAQFWALLIRNKKHAPNSVPILVPVWGPILGLILGTNLEHFFLLGCWLLKIVVLGFRSLGCQAFGKSNLFKSKMVFAQVVRRKGRRISVELFHSQWLQACFVLPSLAATVVETEVSRSWT